MTVDKCCFLLCKASCLGWRHKSHWSSGRNLVRRQRPGIIRVGAWDPPGNTARLMLAVGISRELISLGGQIFTPAPGLLDSLFPRSICFERIVSEIQFAVMLPALIRGHGDLCHRPCEGPRFVKGDSHAPGQKGYGSTAPNDGFYSTFSYFQVD